MALNTCELWFNRIKIAIFSKKLHEIAQRLASDIPIYNIFVSQKFLFWKFLMTSLHVICGLALPPNQKSCYTYVLVAVIIQSLEKSIVFYVFF